MKALVLLMLLASACKPKGLLAATTSYARTSEIALRELEAIPGIVTNNCYRREQLDYIADQVTIPTAPAPATTWIQACAGYAVAEQTFDLALHAVAAYGLALAAVAKDDDASLRGDLESSTKSLTTTLATVTNTSQIGALGAIGTPLGFIADTVRANWKAKRLDKLIAAAHPQLVVVLDALNKYVDEVKTNQLDATWTSYTLARANMEKDGHATMVATFDVMVRAELEHNQRRLDALSRVLSNIRDAHVALAQGWKAGEDSSASTRARITNLAALIVEDVRRYRRLEEQ